MSSRHAGDTRIETVYYKGEKLAEITYLSQLPHKTNREILQRPLPKRELGRVLPGWYVKNSNTVFGTIAAKMVQKTTA